LAIEELLGDSGGKATEKVTLAIDDNNLMGGRHVSLCLFFLLWISFLELLCADRRLWSMMDMVSTAAKYIQARRKTWLLLCSVVKLKCE
jgi:hypothetical protein